MWSFVFKKVPILQSWAFKVGNLIIFEYLNVFLENNINIIQPKIYILFSKNY